jgi:hypothetical protein
MLGSRDFRGSSEGCIDYGGVGSSRVQRCFAAALFSWLKICHLFLLFPLSLHHITLNTPKDICSKQ